MRECTECGTPFEPITERGRPPMTCSEPCRIQRKTRQSNESRDRAAARECPDHLHGTSTGYTYYKCTCTKCTRWARGYKAHRRALARENAPSPWLETEQL